ncbi:MAG TPA: AlpA family transcriptional regulator [Steroidobacteraceae bacterium]|nr:AlpA family transcriptional regulator [Steroidobacteraceae bacterium]
MMLSQETETAAPPTPGRLLRLKEVRQRTSLSSSSIYRLSKDGLFPKPIKLSERASAWLEAEIDQWIAERISASRPVGGALQ